MTMRPETSYVVCTLPRSGSNLLCEALGLTDQLGYPTEYFSENTPGFYRRVLGAQRARNYNIVFDYAMRFATSPNGVCGIKILHHQLATLKDGFRSADSFADLHPIEIVDRLLPNPTYVYLKRRDKIRQAISYYRAHASSDWVRLTADRDDTAHRGVAFDAARILDLVRTFEDQERDWPVLLDRISARVLHLDFDDMVKDFHRTVVRVHEWMGVRPPPGPITPGLERQSDDITEEWVHRIALMRQDNAIASGS